MFQFLKRSKPSLVSNNEQAPTAGHIIKIDGDFGDNLDLQVSGENNRLSIERPAEVTNLKIVLTGEASVSIGAGCILRNLFIYATPGSCLVIGQGVGFNGPVQVLLHEPKTITIGDHSLIGTGVLITVSDMHSILDAATGKRINHARDVTIAPRVWVAHSSFVLKGATIGEGSVIGANSVVTGEIPPNCIAVGSPARVTRRGITWHPLLINP